MFSSELYKKYIESTNERYALENKINEYIEKWKNGEIVLSTEQVEKVIEKGYERLEDLKKIEESIHQDFIQMSSLEEQKKSADIGIRNVFGEAPTNMNIVDGVISNYSEYELEQHKANMTATALRKFAGYVHPELNIYITYFGAWMSNCSLEKKCDEEEKEKVLSKKYWQEYIKKGYNLVIAPSFNDPQYQAIYVTNWKEVIDPKWGVVVGCPQAKNVFGSMKKMIRR